MLEWLDWSCIALYFVLVFGVAAWATFRERSRRGTSADYFLAGRGADFVCLGMFDFQVKEDAELTREAIAKARGRKRPWA